MANGSCPGRTGPPPRHPGPSSRASGLSPAPQAPSGIPGPLPMPGDPGADPGAAATQQLQVQLPPAPEIPPVPKGQATPAAIIGILSVPDVLRVSTAYQIRLQGTERTRGQKLNEDAQKEQGRTARPWPGVREPNAASCRRNRSVPRSAKSQDRATEAQRRFGERNRIIQEAGQYVMMQINRTMEQVAQQVALSRGINLVLNQRPDTWHDG